MKTPLKTLLIAALAHAGLSVGANAAIILSQDFSTGDGSALLGTTSTVGNTTWSGNSLLNTAGYTLSDGGAIGLAFTPVSGKIYDLTATINIAPANTTWIGAGFLPSTGADAYSFLATPNTPTAVRNGDAWSTFPGANYSINSADLRIRLDTTGAQWKSSYFQGGVQMGSTHTYTSGNPTINYVGFVNAEGGGVGGVSAFQLTAIPEPSTYAMVIGGILNLSLIRRRRVRA